MLHHNGKHKFRYVNFVEMNFPVFSRKALEKYMSVYDGELSGWGNDWWYLNILEANNKKCCAITDKIIVVNPTEKNKDKSCNIENIVPLQKRIQEWEEIKKKYNLLTWEKKTIEFI
jgi:hypothetical protein